MGIQITPEQNPEAFIMAWLEDGLGVMKKFKPQERSETARRWAIAITDTEKIVAYWKYALSKPVEDLTPLEYKVEVREALSDLQHQIWAHWMEYLFSKCSADYSGALVIPAESVIHWSRQINLSYENLEESEKDSDREQAAKVIKVLEQLSYQSNVGKA